MSILRKQLPRSNYTVLDNGLLRDRGLSWAARGMLAFLLSKPDGWEVREANLVNESDAPRQGLSAVRAILAELEGAGYLRRGWYNDERGIRRRVTEVSDTPALFGGDGGEDDSTGVRFTDVGFSDVGKSPAIVSTDPNEVPKGGSSPATPTPPSAEPESAASHYGDLFVAVRDACRFDAKLIPPQAAKNVADAAKRLAKAEAQPSDVKAAAARWYTDDWRGKKGQPPTVSQFEEWVATCRTAAHPTPTPTDTREPAARYFARRGTSMSDSAAWTPEARALYPEDAAAWAPAEAAR